MVNQRCPRCGGNLFFDNLDGFHYECLQCGKQFPIPENSPEIPKGMKPRFDYVSSSSFQVHQNKPSVKNIHYQES